VIVSKKQFNDTLASVRKWLRTERPKERPVFSVSEVHPFCDEINSANIPSRNGLPDLLMHRLPQDVTHEELRCFVESRDEIIDIETVPTTPHVDLSKEARILLHLMNEHGSTIENRIIVLVGTSGCGKTRTLYELMCCYYGLYFTASVAGNGGSKDTSQLVKKVEALLRHCNEHEVVAEVEMCVGALIFSRLSLLRVCFEEWPQMTPYDWLLLQTVYFPSFGYGLEDPQELLYLAAANFQHSDLNYQDSAMFLSDRRIFIALDESQIFLRSCCDFFSSTTDPQKKRPLFAPLMRGLETTGLQVLVAGTGLQLEEALEITASAVRKDLPDLQRFVFSAFQGFQSEEQLEDYLRRIFPHNSSAFLSAKVFDWMRGRYRFTSDLVKKVLVKEVLVHQTPSSGVELIKQTLAEVLLEESPDELPQCITNTIISHLVGLDKLPNYTVSVDGCCLFEALFELVSAYYLFGTRVLFPNPRLLILIERGICTLVRGGDHFSAMIAEPLTAFAAAHYFKLKSRSIEQFPFAVMGLSQPVNPSICGFFFERCVIPAVIKYLGSYSLIKHPYYKKHVEANGHIPEWAKSAQVRLPKQTPVTQPLVLKKNSTEMDLSGYYTNPDCCDAFIPDKLDRHDAIFQLFDSKNNQRILALAQWRFVKKMSKATVTKALKTTDYTVARMKQKGKDDPLKRAQQEFAADRGTLRILFTFPFEPSDSQLPDCVEGEDVYLICSQDRTPDIFDKEIWDFLKAVKLKCEAAGVFLQ